MVGKWHRLPISILGETRVFRKVLQVLYGRVFAMINLKQKVIATTADERIATIIQTANDDICEFSILDLVEINEIDYVLLHICEIYIAVQVEYGPPLQLKRIEESDRSLVFEKIANHITEEKWHITEVLL